LNENFHARIDTDFKVVLSRSFSAFSEHPFLFIGLCFLAQIPGTTVSILLWDLGAAGRITSMAVNFIFALMIQGAVACAVYDTHQGYGARFAESLAWGIGRIGPLTLGGLALVISFFLEISLSAVTWGATVLILIGNIAGVFIVALPALLILISLAVVWLLWTQLLRLTMTFVPAFLEPILSAVFAYSAVIALSVTFILLLISPCFRWAVFVPACVVEQLGTIESLNRSSELGKGFNLDIFILCLLYFLGATVFIHLWLTVVLFTTGTFPAIASIELDGSFAGMIILFFAMVSMVEPGFTLGTALRLLTAAIPMAFGYVMIATAYYELRHVKEGLRYYEPYP